MKEQDFIEAFLAENTGYVRDKYRDRGAVTVTTKKSGTDLLTEVDLTIQKRFVEKVQEAFPGDVIVGEENGFTEFPEDPNARAWVIDPIDGTYNFVRARYPIFGISIAFAQNNTPMAGGVALPTEDLTYLAARGRGAALNGKAIQVSQVQHLNEACIDFDMCSPPQREKLFQTGAAAMMAAGVIRSLGSAVVSICQIASGHADGYVHMSLNPWDFAASQVILEEAGGVATRLDGSPLRLFDPKDGMVMSNGAIQKELLALMR